MNIKTISRDLWLLTNFVNGWEMVRYLRDPHPIAQAKLLNGKTIVHPSTKLGLVESILELWFENCYFPKFFDYPQKNDVVVDIGANIGLFTIQVSQNSPDCRIAAFEPFPENFNCLSNNIINFGLKNSTVHQYAVSNNYRQDVIVTNGSRSLDNHLRKQSENNSLQSNNISVNVIPLEGIFDILKSPEISLMKIDIEGAERDIFESVNEKTLKCIHSLAIEYHDNLCPGTLNLITKKLTPTHHLKTLPSHVSGCGLLFAVRRI
ncbi:MAG: FkbM family methyltransferase [Nostocaceae cyanobacterium]|nr:FkbM family methyltransferase [Nostocaceae cyanobacterium]